MGGEEKRNRGPTKRYTREELAELADKARGAPAPTTPATPATIEEALLEAAEQPEITPMSRAQTVHDPMTTQLLAEVARRLQTMELEVPDGADTVIADDEELERAHPNLRRRR